MTNCNIFILMHSVSSWLVDALPEVSNFVLLLAGFVMSYPKLAERIESHRIARYGLGGLCILVGGYGLVVGVSERRQTTVEMGSLLKNTTALVSNTNSLVINMNTAVATLAVLQPEFTQFKAQASVFDEELQSVKGGFQTHGRSDSES